jgi:hypothetical protein
MAGPAGRAAAKAAGAGIRPQTGPNSYRLATSRDDMNDATQVLGEGLIGRQLSAVTFVMDYFQFDFDGNRLTVLTNPKVDLYSEDVPNFRDSLCTFIAREVTSAEELTGEAIHIGFGNTGRLIIPLDSDSRVQVEAAYLSVKQRTVWTW